MYSDAVLLPPPPGGERAGRASSTFHVPCVSKTTGSLHILLPCEQSMKRREEERGMGGLRASERHQERGRGERTRTQGQIPPRTETYLPSFSWLLPLSFGSRTPRRQAHPGCQSPGAPLQISPRGLISGQTRTPQRTHATSLATRQPLYTTQTLGWIVGGNLTCR